eukprot:jgi/Ulvmu1/9691/UM055_0029.1
MISMNSCRQRQPRVWRCLQVSRCELARYGARCVGTRRSIMIVRCSGSESDGIVDPVHLHREKELSRREDQLWQRMELLLDRESELREQELSSANRREAHLQSQVDMLLSILSNTQSDKTLPPGAAANRSTPQDPPPQRIADVLQTMQETAANQDRGTFVEYHEDSMTNRDIDQVIREGPAGAQRAAEPPAQLFSSQAAEAERPSFASEIQGVVDDVLKGRSDPLESIDWSDLKVPRRQGSAAGPDTPPATAASPTAPQTPAQPSPASARGGAAPMSIADAMVAAAAAAAEAGDGPVETEKAPKDGKPPILNIGDDDIYWTAALQRALLKNGVYCGEDDEADFYFGSGTQTAVLTYQAINNLPETGVADEATWAALAIHSGADVSQDSPSSDAGSSSGTAAVAKNPAEEGIIWQQGDKVGGAGEAQPTNPAEDGMIWQQGDKPDGGSFGGLFAGLGLGQKRDSEGNGSAGGAPEAAAAGGKPAGAQSARRREKPEYDEWPVLRESDGERAVHTLHVMLQQQGFHPEEEDVKWWMFGSSTVRALSTFQACSGLPETGVCDVATWHALMGDNAKPQDIDLVFSGDSDDEDLEQIADGRVYLLGEQRWSKY